jgi:hypothetical protein
MAGFEVIIEAARISARIRVANAPRVAFAVN